MKRSTYIATALAVLPLLAFGPTERAPTHWALLIGISDYIHFDDVEGGDLPGAEHDAYGWRDYFVMHEGFPEENVRLLVNHDATKAAIREAITEWLAESVEPGDNVVIAYSGHGSQMWDESGDEDDGLDETLAPADVLPTSTEADISDDEFNDWLGLIRSENVVVILDNCNSGTGTRDVTPFSRGRLLGRDINTIERPDRVTRRALPGQQDETGFDAAETRVLELAAAQPFQVAVDAFFPASDGAEEFHGGAFTTFLLKELWRAPGDATYDDVFRSAHEALKRNRFQQDPYISEEIALKDSPVFFVEGGSLGRGDMSLPVMSESGSTVELGGGLALGVTQGSVFETTNGARLVVETVGQRSTTARLESGSVDSGEYARLTAHRYARAPLVVSVAAIDTRLGDALRSAVADAPSIRLVDSEETFSHLILRRRGDALRVVGADGFVRHDGTPATVESMAEVGDLLRKEAAAKSLGDMENPAQSFALDLQLLGAKTSFGVGEEIGFTVESGRDGYLTLVDLGTDGTVSVLLPNEESPSVRIGAGQRLSFPDGDVYFVVEPPVGTGMVRAFLTPEPLPLTIPAGTTYLAGGAELAAEVTAALIAAAGSDGSAVRLDSWGSASVVYEIHD